MDMQNENYMITKKKYIYSLLILAFFIFLFILSNKIDQKRRNKYRIKKINSINSIEMNNSYQKCYITLANLKIIHLIISRFLIEFYFSNEFPKKLYEKDYILNGIRVMKKYLLPSLENQSCKNFTWILMLGNKANITYIKSLINFNNSFSVKVIYQKDIKNYVRNITKGFDVLITTRIDYDDIIYYDAVNDVRKAINIHKPLLLYGYKRGIYYFESDKNYYDFYRNYKNKGCMSIFVSLIIVLNKVNDTVIVYDLIGHSRIREKLLKVYKKWGLQKLDYEPSVFDSGDPKFVWVRQKYSGSFQESQNKNQILKININKFNLNKFYGK